MPMARCISLSVRICCAAILAAPLVGVYSQAAPATSEKLPLNAVLVLTPDFCATKFTQGSFWTTGKETFEVGKEACADLEPALKSVFLTLSVASAPPESGSAQVILTPRFVNGHATTAAIAFSNREMDVLLEWTVKDSAGRTLWLQTVQGSAQNHMGSIYTHGHDVKLIAANSVHDAAKQSAAQMMAAQELRKFADENTKSIK
jgi:hypothetical protein